MRSPIKKLLSLVIALIMVLSCLPMSVLAAENTTAFQGGDGTAENPYQIANKVHFRNARIYPSAHFIVVADIDFTGTSYESIPNFAGVFDGNGHVFSGIGSQEQTHGYALFSNNSGTIKNLRITDSYFFASICGVITDNNSGTISNCYLDVEMLGDDLKSTISAGGIAGTNTGVIEDCVYSGKVECVSQSSSNVGGIVGDNRGTVRRCASFAETNSGTWGDNNAGGIVGLNSGIIDNCYFDGVSDHRSAYKSDGTSYHGGIVGKNEEGAVTNCYSIGKVAICTSGDELMFSGGIAGYSLSGISNCYYLDTTADSAVGNGKHEGEKASLSKLQEAATYRGFDFENVWSIQPELGYPMPVLACAVSFYTAKPENTTDFAGGNGTPWSPYLISNVEQLNNIRNFPNESFRLVADLDLSASVGESNLPGVETTWTPIESFSGNLDGNGHTISGLSFIGSLTVENDEEDVYLGFVLENTGVISNLTLQDPVMDLEITLAHGSTMNYYLYLSYLVAMNDGEILNCQIDATMDLDITALGYSGQWPAGYPGSDIYVGLIAGMNYYSINGCKAFGSMQVTYQSTIEDNRVNDDLNLGGIAGYNYGSILNATNATEWNIDAKHGVDTCGEAYLSVHVYAGGIAGTNDGVIRRGLSNGKLTGAADISIRAWKYRAYVGGGEGYSYHTAYIGGIAGFNEDESLISQCAARDTLRYELTMSGSKENKCSATFECAGVVGGLVGTNRGTMTNSYSAANLSTSGNNNETWSLSGELSMAEGGLAGWGGEVIEIGYDTYYYNGTIDHCYSVSNVVIQEFNPEKDSAVGDNVGGAKNNYALQYGDRLPKGATGCTEAQLQKKETFEGFDFESIWCFDTGDGYYYPQLQFEKGALTKIEILGTPGTISMIEDLIPDLSHIQLRLTYATGKTSIVALDSNYLGLLDTGTPGVQTIAVSSQGVTSKETLTFDIASKKIMQIAVTKYPAKTANVVNCEALDLTDAVLSVYFDNDTVEDIPLTQEMLSGYDLSVYGLQQVTVTYEGHTTSMELCIGKITAIEMETMPTKTRYVQGQPLKLDGGVMRIIHDCVIETVTYTVPLDQASTIVYDTEATGNVAVEVHYRGGVGILPVVMEEKMVLFVDLYKPTKLTYYVGEELDLTGGYLNVIYQSYDPIAYSEIFELTPDMVSGYDPNQVGVQTLAVTTDYYVGSFNVTVKERKVLYISIEDYPETSIYPEGTESMDVTGITVTITYDDLTKETIPLTLDMVSGFDGNRVGSYTVTITYKDKVTYYPIQIVHTYTEKVVAPTCTENGYTDHICTACGDSYQDTEVAKLDHKWTDATCESAKTCSVCGRMEGSALGHKWDGGVVTKPATETEEGVKTITCTACGKTKTESISVLDHTHQYEKTIIAATCEAEGYDKYTCACGDNYTDNMVAALGHKWSDATCAQAKTCAICGKTEGEALGHDFKDGACTICGIEDIVAGGDVTAIIHWKLDSEGKLTISGADEMTFGDGESLAPWAAYADQIVSVVIEDGVTSIADSAFAYCKKLEKVTIAATVEVVGESAFANCEILKEITFQGEAPKLGANCFENVSATVTHPAVDSWKEETLTGTGGEIVLEPAKPKQKKGDINGDGKVDYKDAMLVLRASVGLETLNTDAKTAGDVDGNNKLDYKDAMKILRASVGLEEL